MSLNPKIVRGGNLHFDCPLCLNHRVKLDGRWATRGNFETLRITPATIIASCGHMFTIKSGEITKLERNYRDERFTAQ